MEEINAVIGRGGFIKSVSGGVYEVNEQMLADLSSGRYGGIHPSNLGGILAHEIAQIAHCPSFIANPVVIDEMQPLARYSGMPENPRISIFHALSQKRVARMIANKLGKNIRKSTALFATAGAGLPWGPTAKAA